MRIKQVALSSLMMFLAVLLLPCLTRAQSSSVAPRITQSVDNTNLIVLHGNTHPLALPKYDQGAAPSSLPMQRMLLVLQRSPAQEAALEQLLEQQQDNSSPNYHQWLTPQEFGLEFGPADQDIQTITTWLQSHGFQVNRVSSGRVVIEFSGTAGQVEEAFHTAIHKYAVNGEEHWANANDPEIPAALAGVVGGVESLNNFPRKPHNHVAGVFAKSKSTGKIAPVKPLYTLPDENCGVSGTCYAIGPYDFATIYNLLPLWNPTTGTAIDGTGQTIAIVAETDINPADVTAFRSFLGISTAAGTVNVIHDGPAPGILQDGEETESDLDVEWSGSIAKGATIDFVVSTATETTPGIDLSAEYIVDNNLAPVMSESYGECELGLGTSGNEYFAGLWQQASAEGITVFISAGDSGSAGCDDFDAAPPSPSVYGLQVSGYASTPYNVAVGGTDFNDALNAQLYWSNTNAPGTFESALGYIPETTWNDTCTNGIFASLGYSANAETNCNNQQLLFFVSTLGGSGGTSACTTPTGNTASSCAGGYTRPPWQTGTGVGTGVNREIPDVSLYAASGSPSGAGYIVCESDVVEPSPSCAPGNPDSEFLLVGGTSASSPAFAGIMALVNQKTGQRQGNANYVLYKMAGTSANSCNSSTISTTQPNSCIFYDVTNGTNAMPCAVGSSSSCGTIPGNFYGILTGYNTGTGYDEATGLGSVNVTNLVNQWSTYAGQFKATKFSSFTLGPPASITHGQSIGVAATVVPLTGTGTPTGTITLTGATGSVPSGQEAAQQVFTLTNGSIPAGATTIMLPGGTNEAVTAHYSGDTTFAPSNSAPFTVTVNPEASKSQVVVETYNAISGEITNSNATSFTYGTPTFLRANVMNSSGNLCVPAGVATYGCPTGTVSLMDTLNGVTTTFTGGPFGLNSEGYTEDPSVFLLGGSHSIVASYSGDNSFNASTVAGSSDPADVVTVNKATATATADINQDSIPVGTPLVFLGIVNTQVTLPGGAPTSEFPSGILQVFNGGNPITSLNGPFNTSVDPNTGFAQAQVNLTLNSLPIGNNTITVQYSGDTNYSQSAISYPATVDVQIPTTSVLTTSNPNVQVGTGVTFTAQITPTQSFSQPMTGTVQFNYSPPYGNIGAAGIVNGKAVITTTTLPFGTYGVTAAYDGDTNYAGSAGGVTQTVNAIATTTGVTSSNLSIQQGATVTFTATVTPVQPFSPAPTGTMQFGSNGLFLGNTTVSNNQAQFTTSSLTAGSDLVTASYLGDSNYSQSQGNLTETVTGTPTFTASASPTTVPVAAPGDSGTATLTFSGMNGYSGTIPLSSSLFSGLPSETTCSFNVASVVLSGSGSTGTATITCQTTAASGALPQATRRLTNFRWWNSRWWNLGGAAALACVFFVGILLGGFGGKRLRWNTAFALIAMASLLAIASCGDGGGGGTTPPGNPGTPVGLSNVLITFSGAGVTPAPTVNLSINVE